MYRTSYCDFCFAMSSEFSNPLARYCRPIRKIVTHNSNLRIKHFLEESGRQLLYSIRAINYKFMDSLMQAACVCLSVVDRALVISISSAPLLKIYLSVSVGCMSSLNFDSHSYHWHVLGFNGGKNPTHKTRKTDAWQRGIRQSSPT